MVQCYCVIMHQWEGFADRRVKPDTGLGPLLVKLNQEELNGTDSEKDLEGANE